MSTRALKLAEIKQELSRLPEDKLSEVRAFIRKLVPPKAKQGARIQPLRGIWKGLGWEMLDLEKEIKELRRESAQQILDKFDRCDT